MNKPYFLSLRIADLPKMANPSGRSTHWRIDHGEKKKWHALVAYSVGINKPPTPLEHYSLILVRSSSSMPDYDGLVRGFKYVVDGLKACGVILDDKLSNSGKWDCDWVPGKRGDGYIMAQVRACEQMQTTRRVTT